MHVAPRTTSLAFGIGITGPRHLTCFAICELWKIVRTAKKIIGIEVHWAIYVEIHMHVHVV